MHHIKYSESSLIAKIYTEAFGLQAYLVKGARSKRSSMRSSMFQPMTSLELVVYHRPQKDLQHIREASVAEPFHSISSDLRKSTVAIFLAEIFLKTAKEGEANEDLFEFLNSSLLFFDMQKEGVENFHLYFLVRLSRYLGFSPQADPKTTNTYFDLREGKFASTLPPHPDHLDGQISSGLYTLTKTAAGDLGRLTLNKNIRNELMNAILLYYQIHLSGLGKIKSLEVLREVFS